MRSPFPGFGPEMAKDFAVASVLATCRVLAFPAARMSSLPTADLLALDLDGLKSRLSKLRRYL
jgi:hypothetical protein